MATENEQVIEETPKKKKKGKKLILILLVLILAAGGAGAFMFLKGKGKHKGKDDEVKELAKKTMLDMTPFIVNLIDQRDNKFLKVTMSLEFSDEVFMAQAKENMPQVRDIVITLLTSKTAEELMMQEGKLQLKDDINMRLNQIIGKNAVTNVYLTEFVMQ